MIFREITISEQEARDCRVYINIKRKGQKKPEPIFDVYFGQEDIEGTMYVEGSFMDPKSKEALGKSYENFFKEAL